MMWPCSAIRHNSFGSFVCLDWARLLSDGHITCCCVQNGIYTVGGSIQTPINANSVYDMLVDYPHLNRVFSSIDECHTSHEKNVLQLLQVSTNAMLNQLQCVRACII